ncbi:Calcium-dependent lipid-binding family protein isoform 2 [Hibiscus syriacus]|uniref:Calcium-dependent lipid-binding family protein isoform 2 n=1 Tax=Hibiscus syriacus TaxID=106335 RepID=A0A6A2Y1T1_HIBSY|nr:16 kDa phloem protein 1-like [Hibiscus syriacus]KAE8669276.1 Calcium-dependent lipid-binding family protein isoform 2 [Hibiscus syriacus]
MAVGILEVFLVSAKGLEDSYFLGGGSDPSWNERFTFKAEYSGSGDGYKVVLKIMDKDTFSSDDFVGQATVYVKDLLAIGAEEGKAEIHPTKQSVVNAENSYCGDITVGVTFTRKVEGNEDEDEDEEYGGWRQSNF